MFLGIVIGMGGATLILGGIALFVFCMGLWNR